MINKVKLLVLLGFIYTPLVFAARPLITDDASITDNCQVESWWQREQGDNSLWVQPACKIANIEWALGFAQTSSDEANIFAAAAKKEFLNLDEDSFGLTFQLAHEFAEGQANQAETHLNFALSKYLVSEDVLLHVNLGRFIRAKQTDDWFLAAATEWQFLENHFAFVEAYRESAGRPFYQLGYFWEIVPDQWQWDINYGNQLSSSANDYMITSGLVFYF